MKKNILLIDDNRAIYDSVKIIFHPRYNIHYCKDTKSARKTLTNKNNIDLILLDLMMPEESGLSFLGKMKENITVPVIVISSNKSINAVREAFKRGAADYILKPFNVRTISEAVEEQLQ